MVGTHYAYQSTEALPNGKASTNLLMEPALTYYHTNIVVLTFVFAALGALLQLLYARLILAAPCFPDGVRLLIRNYTRGANVFLVTCIFRSAYSLLSNTVALTFIANLRFSPTAFYWICSIIEIPYVIGFVVATASVTVLIAEHFRMSVLSFSSTMKSRQDRLERRHQRSIEKSILLSWLLGVVIAGAFLMVAMLQATFLPKKSANVPSLAYCSLIATVPDPILYSVVILFLALETSMDLTFVMISLYRQLCGWLLYTQHLNRAQTSLHERGRVLNDQIWWRSMWPCIVLHKMLIAATVTMAMIIKYYLQKHMAHQELLMLTSHCTLLGQVCLILPVLIHIPRESNLRSKLAIMLNEACRKFVWRCRGCARRHDQSDDQERRY